MRCGTVPPTYATSSNAIFGDPGARIVPTIVALFSIVAIGANPVPQKAGESSEKGLARARESIGECWERCRTGTPMPPDRFGRPPVGEAGCFYHGKPALPFEPTARAIGGSPASAGATMLKRYQQ
jgi:hypothetical protein